VVNKLHKMGRVCGQGVTTIAQVCAEMSKALLSTCGLIRIAEISCAEHEPPVLAAGFGFFARRERVRLSWSAGISRDPYEIRR